MLRSRCLNGVATTNIETSCNNQQFFGRKTWSHCRGSVVAYPALACFCRVLNNSPMGLVVMPSERGLNPRPVGWLRRALQGLKGLLSPSSSREVTKCSGHPVGSNRSLTKCQCSLLFKELFSHSEDKTVSLKRLRFQEMG